MTDVLLHSEGLPARLLSRYCAERAAPVEIDREAIERLGVRVQRARCCPTRFTSSCAHDPDRLALAVHDLGAEVRRLAR